MIDSLSLFSNLRRPPLLIRAARIGVTDYNRNKDLRRFVKSPTLPGPREAIIRLMEEEAELNDARRERNGHYNVMRHVDIMIVLLGEALLIKAAGSSSMAPN